jgi:signal transduction histidine kinase
VQGRLIVPNAWLMALELMKSPSNPAYRQTAMRLFDRLNEYQAPLMASSQRLFLMKQLQAQWPECSPFPTMAGEELAAEYLESNPAQLRAGKLQPTPLPEIWAFLTQDQKTLALFRLDHLLAAFQATINTQRTIPQIRFTLLPPEKAPSGIVPFLSTSLANELSSWQLILSMEDSDPFDSVSRQKIAVYLWIGVLVTLVLVLLASMLAVYLRRQIRLTRLKNDLIATVSHELKTPLASMRLLVDTLLAGHYRDPQQVIDYLRLIGKENARLSNLIDNFLAFSRMERKKTTFDRSVLHAEEIVNAAMEAMGDRLKAPSCQVKVNLDPELPAINGDRDALVTVVVNLLDNALKYSGEHKQIQLRSFASNGTVSIEVGDNGMGFSRRAAKRIFDRFYQVDRSLSGHAGGCGLGLSIVKFIVTAHGGSVEATSQPGKGSTFTVRLPAIAGSGIA